MPPEPPGPYGLGQHRPGLARRGRGAAGHFWSPTGIPRWIPAGAGGPGGNGFGGGLYVAGGTVSLTSDTLTSNTAQGGDGGFGGYYYVLQRGGRGGNGGNGFGAGLYAAGGTVTLTNDTIARNTAQGGNGGNGGNGSPRGSAGAAGLGEGGGLYIVSAASVWLDGFTLAHFKQNRAAASCRSGFRARPLGKSCASATARISRNLSPNKS